MSAGGMDIDGSYSWDSDDTFSMTISMTLPNGASHTQTATVTVKSLDDSGMTLVIKDDRHEQEQTLTRVQS